MARQPFDPNRVKPPASKPDAAALFGEPEKRPAKGAAAPLTVSQLSALVRDTLAAAIPGKLRVVGEVSNFSARNHWFFSLKDAAATVKCVCFASSAKRVRFPMKDGMQVVATGRLDYYDAQGSLQLYVDSIEPVGQGSLELQFRALCEELRQLGYFETQRKKPLPIVPLNVAVITSITGAALQDVINTAGRRWPGCRLLVFDVRVQGAQAAPEVARAIDLVSAQGPALGIDAIILTRGGGSIEDLWAFNERIVADALFRCSLPTIAAIGHETDTTIAELVADHRAATPTQAAMQLIPDQKMLTQQVEQYSRRMTQQLQRQIQHARQRVNASARHPFLRTPGRMLQPARLHLATLAQRLSAQLPRRARTENQRLNAMRQRLATAVASRHSRERQRLDTLERTLDTLGPRAIADASAKLQQATDALRNTLTRRLAAIGERTAALERQLKAVGPQRVLDRGFSYTLGADEKVLRRPADVKPGETITTVLAQGRLKSVVEGVESRPAKPPPAAPPVRHKKKQAETAGGLFDSVE